MSSSILPAAFGPKLNNSDNFRNVGTNKYFATITIANEYNKNLIISVKIAIASPNQNLIYMFIISTFSRFIHLLKFNHLLLAPVDIYDIV